ncbi:MAG TPA: zf-HC2 domain-containing protein [Elusimicrobiota bacterium]|jgi:anti-sigma factor RsiW|nr:zf-HC2 domain-containing protein [Elusimicrobiota bacterium]
MTHETDEDLSALLDGELPDAAAARARSHAASCADCAARMDRLRAASIAFRRSGERPAPAGLAERVKAAGRPRIQWAQAVLAVAFAAALVLIGGAMVKKFLPGLFDNTQQSITGAAGSMGSGGR